MLSGCRKNIFEPKNEDFNVKAFISSIKSYDVKADYSESIIPTDTASAEKPYISVQSWVIKGKDILISVTVPGDAEELYFGAVNPQADYLGLNFSGQNQNSSTGFYSLKLTNIPDLKSGSDGYRNYQVVLSSNEDIQLDKFDLIASYKSAKGISNIASVPIDVIGIAPYQKSLRVGFRPLQGYTYSIKIGTPNGSQIIYSFDNSTGNEVFDNSQSPASALSYDSDLDFKWIDFSDPQFGSYTMNAKIQIDFSGGSQTIYLLMAIVSEGKIDQMDLDADIQQTGENSGIGSVNVGFNYFEEFSVKVKMFAFRQQTRYFNAAIVPDEQKISPGVGIRYNGDHNSENLIKVTLSVDPIQPPNNITYMLRRNNQDIKVWSDYDFKEPILESNNDAIITFTNNNKDVYVENVICGNSELELIAMQNNSVLNFDKISFYTFNSMILVFGGWRQNPQNYDDPDAGSFDIGYRLFLAGYNVYIYSETEVPWGQPGTGLAATDLVNAIKTRNISKVGICGYSYGGGSTYRLCEYLFNNSSNIGPFDVDFTAYIDAINSAPALIIAEDRFPLGSSYHVNYYQTVDKLLRGTYVTGADTNQMIQNVDHTTIDDNIIVKSGIETYIKKKIKPW